MMRSIFICCWLLQGLVAGKPERPTQPRAYLDEARQFMKYFRETSHYKDSLLVEEGAGFYQFYVREAFKDSADITEEGRRELLAWLYHPLLERWTPELLGGSPRLISRDSMGRLVQEAEAVRKRDKFPEIFMKEAVYAFSAPIFFRHDSLCLFYTSWYQGSLSARWTVYLYRRDGSRWKMVKVLYSAVS
jgi:hypothetical protein